MVLFLTWFMIILDIILLGAIFMEKKAYPEQFQWKKYSGYLFIIGLSIITLILLQLS